MALPEREYTRSGVRLSEAVTVGKAAKEFGVTAATVRNWIAKGYIRAIKLPSGQRRIPETELGRVLRTMFALDAPEREVEQPAASFGAAAPDWDEAAV